MASNDGYAYKHLATSHLNILWGCGECFNFVHNNLSTFCQDFKEKHDKWKSTSKKCVESGNKGESEGEEQDKEVDNGEPEDKGLGWGSSSESKGSGRAGSKQESNSDESHEVVHITCKYVTLYSVKYIVGLQNKWQTSPFCKIFIENLYYQNYTMKARSTGLL